MSLRRLVGWAVAAFVSSGVELVLLLILPGGGTPVWAVLLGAAALTAVVIACAVQWVRGIVSRLPDTARSGPWLQ